MEETKKPINKNKFDTNFINLELVENVTLDEDSISLRIPPISYNDGIRNPRLPRKSSKQTNLQLDTDYIFEYAF